MKKTIAFLLTLIMALSLCACGEKMSNTDSGDTKKDPISMRSETQDENKFVIITKEEFATYLREVEITEKNWREYFQIYEEKYTNASGEVESSKKKIGMPILCWWSDDFAVELNVGKAGYNNVTFGTKGSLTWYGKADEEFNLDDFTFVSAKGKMIVADIPDDLWREDRGSGILGTKAIAVFRDGDNGFDVYRNEPDCYSFKPISALLEQK